MCCQKFNAGENTLAATRKKHHYRNKEVVDLQATKKLERNTGLGMKVHFS